MSINKMQNQSILNDLFSIIEKTQTQIAVQANSTLTIMFWQIGKRIQNEILKNERAEYGKEIVVTLSRELSANFGNSFKDKNLRRMVQFYENFQNFENVVSLSRHLSWSHFIVLIPIKTESERTFYAQYVFENLLSVRALRI